AGWVHCDVDSRGLIQADAIQRDRLLVQEDLEAIRAGLGVPGNREAAIRLWGQRQIVAHVRAQGEQRRDWRGVNVSRPLVVREVDAGSAIGHIHLEVWSVGIAALAE